MIATNAHTTMLIAAMMTLPLAPSWLRMKGISSLRIATTAITITAQIRICSIQTREKHMSYFPSYHLEPRDFFLACLFATAIAIPSSLDDLRTAFACAAAFLDCSGDSALLCLENDFPVQGIGYSLRLIVSPSRSSHFNRCSLVIR